MQRRRRNSGSGGYGAARPQFAQTMPKNTWKTLTSSIIYIMCKYKFILLLNFASKSHIFFYIYWPILGVGVKACYSTSPHRHDTYLLWVLIDFFFLNTASASNLSIRCWSCWSNRFISAFSALFSASFAANPFSIFLIRSMTSAISVSCCCSRRSALDRSARYCCRVLKKC